MLIKIIIPKIDTMDTTEETKLIREQFKNSTDKELLTNLRVSKVLRFLFSRNFNRGFLFVFMILISLYFFCKTENEVRLLISMISSLFYVFFISNYVNTDNIEAIEKCTIETLRKMRIELKEKQTT